MKNLIIALIFLSFKTYSQEIQKPLKVEKNDEIFISVEQQAEFPGGPRAFGMFINKNLKYPKAAQRANVGGVVYVKFFVNTDGSIDDVQTLNSVGYGCDEEAMRVIKLVPKWNAAKKDGLLLRSTYTQPITFVLSE
jgi:protein TonB